MSRHLVRNARVFKQGDGSRERVPDGTHVYLDYPGGPLRFRQFVVQGGRLRLAAHPEHDVVLEASYAYFCLWSDPDHELTDVPLHPETAPCQAYEGFGFPLPARFLGNRLVLPDTRTLHLRIVDASGRQETPALIARHLDEARAFYRTLHIELEDHPETLDLPEGTGLCLDLIRDWHQRHRRGFAQQLANDQVFQDEVGGATADEIYEASIHVVFTTGLHRLIWDTPSAAPLAIDITHDWTRLRRAVLQRMQGHGLRGRPPTRDPLPSLTRSPWAPPRAERARTILIIYLSKFRGLGATAGVAWPYIAAFEGIIEQGQLWDHAPCPYAFMAVVRPEAARNVSHSLAHEIAHCLLNDAGASHRRLAEFEEDYQSVSKTQDLLGGLGIETRHPPGEVLYARHVEPRGASMHERGSGNLMSESGGSGLAPWQIAVIRASPSIGDGPTPAQARLARQAPALPEETAR